MDRFPWCAWCDEPVTEKPTTVNGVTFHWVCLKRRMAVVPEQVAGAQRQARALREDHGAVLRRIE